MNREDHPLYKLDLKGDSSFNKVTLEFGKRNSGEHENIFIPLHAPFYINSVQLYHPNGTRMDLDVDYEFYGILGKLTKFTGKPVGLYIRLLKPEITSWKISYQVVGNFNKITNEILNMLMNITGDDRFVDWENISNKPLWFVPDLHGHDWTYEIFMFADLANELLRLIPIQDNTPNNVNIRLDKFQARIDVYIEEYRKQLSKLIADHDAGTVDNHGVNKRDLGRDLVDNFRHATLEETLAGLRSDLHLTPYNATKAAELAAGRNERLYPSGSLPVLRYGSDSFIPPKIDGSFEGMGGIYQRPGACIEANGSLLLLQRRNNGKVKGLYFLKADRWATDRPIWEFTGYRYEHPTATADGAVLSAILAGSNENVMVVGDEDKNIWYWVQTNGTFDPSRHILKRITGDWLNYSTTYWPAASICADKYHKEFNCIVVGIDATKVKTLRPSYIIPPVGSSTLDGWLVFTNINQDGTYKLANIDFTTDDGKFNDKVFTPYIRKYDANNKIIRAAFTPSKPLSGFWQYRTPNMFMKKCTNGQFGILIEQGNFWVTDGTGSQSALTIAWKGYFKPVDGATSTVTITRGEGEKQYTLDPENITLLPDYVEFAKYKRPQRNFSYQFYAGSVFLPPDLRLEVTSAASYSLPLSTYLCSYKGYETGNDLVGPEIPSLYKQIFSTVIDEKNPLGQSGSFLNEWSWIGDDRDPESAIVLARQVVATKEEQIGNEVTKWIARSTKFLKANWDRRTDNIQSGTIGGSPVKYYPLTNETYDVNLGPSVIVTNADMPDGTAGRAGVWRKALGCDAFTLLSGNDNTQGDGLLCYDNELRIVGKKVVFKPTIVYNVKAALARQVNTELAKIGVTGVDTSKSWSIIRAWTTANVEFYLLVVSWKEGINATLSNLYCTVAPIKITPTGTPTTVDGYQYYSDVTLTFLKNFLPKILQHDKALTASGVYSRGTGAEHHTPICYQSWNTKDAAGNYVATGGITMVLRTLHRWSVIGDLILPGLALEIANDYTITRSRVNIISSGLTPESGTIGLPGGVFGYANGKQALTEGAALIGRAIVPPVSGKFYDAYVNATLSPDITMGMSNLLLSTYTIYFKNINNVLMGGKSYNMESTYIDLRDIDSNPANKKFYVYLKFRGGKPVYVIDTATSAESAVNSLLAVVTCGPTQIDTLVPYNRFTMDGAVISDKRQGSSILATAGSIYEVGDTSPIFNPITDYVPE